jgi:hypothetical protein
MKHIGDLVDKQLQEARNEKEERVMLDPLAWQLVDQIFVKMALLCRGFDSFYSDRNRLNAEKTQWVLAFSKLGIKSKRQIEPSLNRLESHKFPNPPQLGEFLDWRKSSPKDIGLPEFEKAYQISIQINQQFSEYRPDCNKTYTVIKHAINSIGSMAYREMKIDKARKMFEYAYDVSCRQLMDGELKEIAKAITEKPNEHPSDKARSADARLKAMEAIRGFGISVKKTN